MSGTDNDLAKAESQAADARRRLMTTAVALQSRLKPAALTRDAVDKLKEIGGDVACAGADKVRRNPGPTVGVVAAITAFLVRKPIIRFFRKKTK
jgi:hypothetical protein